MKTLILITLLSSLSQAYTVNGYYRQNGTYVMPHQRTAPNNNVYDNYSTKGNVNPYNGNVGTVNPYKSYNTVPTNNYNSYESTGTNSTDSYSNY